MGSWPLLAVIAGVGLAGVFALIVLVKLAAAVLWVVILPFRLLFWLLLLPLLLVAKLLVGLVALLLVVPIMIVTILGTIIAVVAGLAVPLLPFLFIGIRRLASRSPEQGGRRIALPCKPAFKDSRRRALRSWAVSLRRTSSRARTRRRPCSTVASSMARPVSCRLHGSRASVNPHGIEIDGRPARLAATVKTSARYICSGSAIRSPSANAGVGLVGIAITSTA